MQSIFHLRVSRTSIEHIFAFLCCAAFNALDDGSWQKSIREPNGGASLVNHSALNAGALLNRVPYLQV